MSTGTDLELRSVEAIALFPGITPEQRVEAATEVANAFSDVVQRQRLFQQIAGRRHVLIEGWQTVGTLVGVFAVKDSGVTQLEWPTVAPLDEEPELPGDEPNKARNAQAWEVWDAARRVRVRWEHHRDLIAARGEGLAYGFTASFRAVKDGNEIGFGEGRCDRGEANWTNRDNHALESMAQTRGQSRTLAAPLRFIVKLAGYASTPAEDLSRSDSDDEYSAMAARISQLEDELAGAASASVPLLDLRGEEHVVQELEQTWPDVDAVAFMTKLQKRFAQEVPEAAGAALRAWAWFAAQSTTADVEAPQTGSDEPTDPEPSTQGD